MLHQYIQNTMYWNKKDQKSIVHVYKTSFTLTGPKLLSYGRFLESCIPRGLQRTAHAYALTGKLYFPAL